MSSVQEIASADDSSKLSMFVPLAKIDEEKRQVWGYAASEQLDKANEILDYEKSKSAFAKWSDDIHKISGGKSLGNVRAMHGNVAAGRLVELTPDDVKKGFWIGAEIDDDNEWAKCKKGTYAGFSIGGRYGDTWPDAVIKGARRYVPQIAETSLVDNPCNPGSTFQLVKADGATETVNIVGREMVQAWLCGTEGCAHLRKDEARNCNGDPMEKRDFSTAERKRAAKSGAAMPGGGYPIENGTDLENAIRAIGRAKNPAATKAHIKRRAAALGLSDKIPDSWKGSAAKAEQGEELKKCMFGVAQLATAIDAIGFVGDIEKTEAELEGDDSAVPGNLDAAQERLLEILVQMAQEELDEFKSDGSDSGDDYEPYGKAVEAVMRKVAGDPKAFRKRLAKPAGGTMATDNEALAKVTGAITEKLDALSGELKKRDEVHAEELKKRDEKIDTLEKTGAETLEVLTKFMGLVERIPERAKLIKVAPSKADEGNLEKSAIETETDRLRKIADDPAKKGTSEARFASMRLAMGTPRTPQELLAGAGR